MTCGCRYPQPRENRGGLSPSVVREALPGYESTDGEVTLGDGLALVREFSGVADAFDVSARTNGALVQITDRTRQESDEITILAGRTERLNVPGSVVMARNLVAGSNAALSVVAYFAKGHRE